MTTTIEDIITNLRAIIISSKGGLKLSDVRTDYQETFGVDIPLKLFGYGSLEELFKKNPENFKVCGNTVQAITKSSSLHIVSLVSRQNSRKRGRSKLSSKQARNLRKPMRSCNDPITNTHGRKSIHNIPSKTLKQNGNKNTLSSALKQMQEIQKITAAKKHPPTSDQLPGIQKIEQTSDKTPEEKNLDIQAQLKNVEELKSITRTVINNQIPSNEDSSSKIDNSNKTQTKEEKVKPIEGIPFEDFEDLHISVKAQSRLLRIKRFADCKLINEDSIEESGENMRSPPPSPFRRSLACNTQEEILSAKKTAQKRLDNNNISLYPKTKNTVDITMDLEDNAKYEHKLKQFCLEKKLILPSYSVIIRETVNQPKLYGCKLSIGGNFVASTYPVETHSEVTARDLAAKKAYNLLTLNKNLPPTFFETESVLKLRALCSEKNLAEPTFKSIECHPKNEPGYFICKVRIGENILLSSYPEEVKDEFSARDLAAKKALNYLLSCSKSSVGISKNNSTTLTKLFDIVKTKSYGVWSNKLPFLYMETYNEELQSNWLELVNNSPKFEIIHIKKAGHIIRGKTDSKLTEDIIEPPVLANLKVPESNQWEVYITNVISSAKIWCRLIGKDYSELYDTMMTKLELQPPTVNVEKPAVGQIYLINLEESWNRVKVIEIFPSKQEASVFLIDIGVDEIVKLSQLFYLQRNFFAVPPQAILLSLNELDCLAECEELQSAMFHCLLGNTFIAEVVAILDEGGNNISSVNLWDTSTEEDVNINLKLIDDVIKTIKSPSLPSVNLVREMFVSHVDDNGNVYLQTSKKKAQYVDWIISIKLKYSGKLVNISKIDIKKLYVTRCNEKGLYYRAKLTQILDVKFVTVKFIDFGFQQQVSMDDLYDLEQTSIDLATIPAQVIHAKFANLKVVNSKVLARIRDYILEQNVLVKVTQINIGSPPAVELFRRSQSDGTLSSINNKIANNEELLVVDTPTRKKSYVVGLESTLSKDLPMPNIPPIGSYFNVIVTLAAHPGLFNVQPLSTQNELMELMFRLQEKCEGSYSKPLSGGDFKIGELYAVKHADDYWYRAYAHAVVSPLAFTVCLCDFGDFIIVPAEKLMPLSSEFKTFPYQAIRAYLAGITPLNKDWSALDCVKFREMVIEKQFVSQVIEINRDLKNPNYITLGLILVDTTTAEDIYIHQLLIESNMAVLKT